MSYTAKEDAFLHDQTQERGRKWKIIVKEFNNPEHGFNKKYTESMLRNRYRRLQNKKISTMQSGKEVRLFTTASSSEDLTESSEDLTVASENFHFDSLYCEFIALMENNHVPTCEIDLSSML